MNIKLSKLYSLLAQIDMATAGNKLNRESIKDEIKTADNRFEEDIEFINSHIFRLSKLLGKNKHIHRDSVESMTIIRGQLMGVETICDNLLDEVKNTLVVGEVCNEN